MGADPLHGCGGGPVGAAPVRRSGLAHGDLRLLSRLPRGVPGPLFRLVPHGAGGTVSVGTGCRGHGHWQTRSVDFSSVYDQGFVRVAACTLPVTIADPHANAAAVLAEARACSEDGVALAVFPELCLAGYSIEDLFLQE